MSENMPNKSQTVDYTKGSVFGVYGCDRISNKIVGKGGKTKCIMPNSKTMGDKKDICTQGITRLSSSIIELNIGAKIVRPWIYMGMSWNDYFSSDAL